jgi:hypothetical protein
MGVWRVVFVYLNMSDRLCTRSIFTFVPSPLAVPALTDNLWCKCTDVILHIG